MLSYIVFFIQKSKSESSRAAARDGSYCCYYPAFLPWLAKLLLTGACGCCAPMRRDGSPPTDSVAVVDVKGFVGGSDDDG